MTLSATLGALLSLLLPWLCGSAWAWYLLGRAPRWNWAVLAGHGYLLGIFLTTLVLRAWALTGAKFDFAGPALTVLALAALGAALAWKGPGRRTPPYRPAGTPPVWQLAICVLLLSLLGWRYLTIAQEVMLRPLFAWDAWMNWAPKAVVWFHYRELVPFVSPDEWLQAPAQARAYTLGAFDAWKFPIGIPLTQLWSMLAIGTSDSSLVYLPWILVAPALGMALYGHLRLLGAPLYLAVAAVYALLSQPFVNVHSALAGYADLWLAAVFGAAVFALAEWEARRSAAYAVVAVAYAMFCAQLKLPGLILSSALLALCAVTGLRLRAAWLLAACLLPLAAILLVAASGIDVTLPGGGELVLTTNRVAIPYLGEFTLAYHPVHAALAEASFHALNWHLLWFIALAALPAVLLRRGLLQANFSTWTAFAGYLAFLLFVYYFTDRYQFALDFSQVNRAMLYAAPLAVFYLFRLVGQEPPAAERPATA